MKHVTALLMGSGGAALYTDYTGSEELGALKPPLFKWTPAF